MKIEAIDEPRAGKSFHFRVTDGTKPTHIEVYLDRVQIMDKDCPDPPCHEMVLIPRSARGAEVLIIARDKFGKTEQKLFKVRDSDVGGMMSAAG